LHNEDNIITVSKIVYFFIKHSAFTGVQLAKYDMKISKLDILIIIKGEKMTVKVITKIAILTSLVLVLSGATILFAQPGPSGKQQGDHPGDRIEKQLTVLKDSLKLSDEQTAKIKTILEDSQKQAFADREKNKGNFEAMDKVRADRRKDTENKIKTVLNDEQKTKFDKIKYELMPERRPFRPDSGGPRPGNGGQKPSDSGK
jgi:periplasmic protein CpxP/Spy